MDKEVTLKDYYIEYYLNGKFVLREQYENFLKKIKGQLWTQEKNNKFCIKENISEIIYITVATLISLVIVLVIIWIYFHMNKRKIHVKQKKDIPSRDDSDTAEKTSEELINLDNNQF